MATDPSINKHTCIREMVPNMKNINTVFIVLDVGTPRRTTQGNEVRTIRVADHTGSINMSVWNDLGDYVSPGDIYKLRGGMTSVFKGQLALSVSKSGEMLKTGEFLLAYSELPDMSAYNAEYAAMFPRKGSPEDEKEDNNGSGGNTSSNHGPSGTSDGAQQSSGYPSSVGGARPPVKRRHPGPHGEAPAKMNTIPDRQRNSTFRAS